MSIAEEIAEHFGLSPWDVARVIVTAPKRYKTFPIPKRSGGVRIIAQPSRELKAFQRFIISSKLAHLPVHPSAMAYVRGRNILENAEAHRHGRAILKLDFTNFFPSILVRDWTKYVRTHEVAAPLLVDLPTYSKLLFWGNGSSVPRCLSIGAPSSPLLSNILMHDFDCKFTELAREKGVAYSRYADDITISGLTIEAVSQFEIEARKLVRQTKSPALRFNDEKRGLYLRGQRRMITGLILTPNGQVSIGRERKRLISAMLHHVSNNTATLEEKARLKGLLGFSISAEPAFIGRMRQKYGSAVVDQSLQYHIPSFAEAQAFD